MPNIALVIGNETYPFDPLSNPINDAKAIKQTLEYKGFEVIYAENLDFDGFTPIFKSFKNLIDQNNECIALFYFAGHGFEINGCNYLLPILDHLPSTTNSMEYIAIKLDEVLDYMYKSKSANNIVILDACRNNPFTSEANNGLNRSMTNFQILSTGFVQTNVQHSTLIAFSTAPGQTASDGLASDQNGLYTKCLIEEIKRYGQTIHSIFSQTRVNVILKSDGKQIPWENNSLLDNIKFDKDVKYALTNEIVLGKNQIYNHPRIFYSSDEDTLLVSAETYLRVYSASDLRNQNDNFYSIEIPVNNKEFHISAFDYDGNYLVIGTSNGEIIIYSDREKNPTIINAHHKDIFAISIVNEWIVSSGIDKTLCIFNISNKQLVKKENNKSIFVIRKIQDSLNVIYFKDQQFFIYNLDENKEKVIKLKNQQILRNLLPAYTYDIKYSASGKYMVTTHDSGLILVWNCSDYSIKNIIQLDQQLTSPMVVKACKLDGCEIPINHIMSASFHNNENILAVNTSDRKVAFIDIEQEQIISEICFDESTFEAGDIAFDQSSEYLFAVTAFSKVSVFETMCD